jgi:hypothetical protein
MTSTLTTARWLRARRAPIVAAVALAGLAAPSCGSKDSLVIVSLTASPPSATLSSLTIDVASVGKTFTIPSGGLGDMAVSFGVYVPSSLTGSGILVTASAQAADGSVCYGGNSNDTNIGSAGVTVTTMIQLVPSPCGSTTGVGGTGGAAGTMGNAGAGGAAGTMGNAGTGGAAGTMGNAGTGGAAGMTGTGGTGQVLAPPSLAKCTEYSHIDALSCDSTSVNGGSTQMWDLAFSPNGKYLATAGDDGRVKIWTMSGSVPSAEGHVLTTSQQAYIAFSPDGKYLVEGSTCGEYVVYDASTFAMVGTLSGHLGDIQGVAFTSDSASVWAVDYDGVLTRHEIGTGSAPSVSVTTVGNGYTIAVSPVMPAGFQWLSVGYQDGTADIANVALPMTTPVNVTVAPMGSVYSLSFSRDGATLAAGADDGTLAFFAIPPSATATPSGPSITIPDSADSPLPIRAVRYSPDGKTLGVGAGSTADAWKLATYDATTRAVKNTKVPTYEPISVAWSPSGGILVAGETNCGKFIICSDN